VPTAAPKLEAYLPVLRLPVVTVWRGASSGTCAAIRAVAAITRIAGGL